MRQKQQQIAAKLKPWLKAQEAARLNEAVAAAEQLAENAKKNQEVGMHVCK